MTEKAPARPFDIRLVIGGLFTFYGVIVLVIGIIDGAAAKKQAGGIDINVWTGLGMLVLGLFFLARMRVNPLVPPPPEAETATADSEAASDH